MFGLVLACALLGQSLSAPSPSNCGTICDHTTGHQVLPGGQSTGGYSNYRKWGSSSSWSSGTVNPGYGSSSSVPARLEDLDEGNVIGLEQRPSGNNGNWRDEKSYVTNDGKGKISYKAEQSVTGNSFRKYAESSYNYGSDAQHQPQPNSQIISPTQFEPRIQDVQRDMDAFIGRFSFAGSSSGSSVNQHTLDIFKQQAQQLTNQLTSLCDRADSSSDEYRRLQAIQRQFDRQVQQKQQEIMSFVYDRQEHYGGSVTSSGGVGSTSGSYTRPQYHPQVTPTYRYPQQPQPTVNPQAAESERLQQECNQLRGNIDAFYKNFVVADLAGYTREDSLRGFQSQVNAEVAAINQQIANLRLDTADFEYQHKFVEDMQRTFERYVQNLNDHLQDCERRIKAEQLRLLQEQERLEEERLQRERAESQRKYDEQVRIAEENHKREQALIQERLDIQRRQEQEERMRIEQRRQPAILLPEVQPLPPRQQQQQQQQQQVTITPNVEVSSNSGGSYTSSFHVSGSQRHEVSGSSSGGQVYQQPMQYGPHVDIVDINNKMNQEFNRLLSSVSGLSSYSMQLTESNHESVNAQFQREFENLRRKIEGLCQQSSQYHNERVLQAAEELKQSLERSLQYFQEECDKVSNAAATSSGSSWSSSGRYTHTRQPHIANVEISHSKSTEIEVTHGGGRPASGAEAQQQVICVEQYADQPCLEPVRVRREAGGN